MGGTGESPPRPYDFYDADERAGGWGQITRPINKL